MDLLMKELLAKNPAPDKATQQLSWVAHMNSLKAQAEEIDLWELIYEEDGVSKSLKNFGTAISSLPIAILLLVWSTRNYRN